MDSSMQQEALKNLARVDAFPIEIIFNRCSNQSWNGIQLPGRLALYPTYWLVSGPTDGETLPQEPESTVS